MPHYKCEDCRTYLHIAYASPAPSVVLCPECRSALDPVADLTELLGLRRIESLPDADRARDDLGSIDGPASAAVALPPASQIP